MECSICLVCQPSIYFERNIDLGMIIRVDVSLSKSIMDVTFSDFECWGQLALLFSISFLFCFLCWCFLKYIVFVGQLLYVRVTAERILLLSTEWEIEWGLNACSGLFLAVGLLMWSRKWLADSLFGEGDVTCRENSDWWKNSACMHYSSGFCFHLLIIFFWSSKRVRDVGKLWKSGMLFLLPSYSIESLRWVFTWKDPFFQY